MFEEEDDDFTPLGDEEETEELFGFLSIGDDE